MENSNYEYEHPLTTKDKETVQQDFDSLQVEVNKVMSSKYYVPLIEEFHVGFEYEIWYSCAYTPELWEKETLELYKGEDLNMLADGCHQLRVKYLDQSDIESLGWKIVEDFYDKDKKVTKLTFEQQSKLYPQERLRLKYTVETQKLWLFMLYDVHLYYNDFKGTIKNKSELKKLMRQLNILTND